MVADKEEVDPGNNCGKQVNAGEHSDKVLNPFGPLGENRQKDNQHNSEELNNNKRMVRSDLLH